MPWVSSSYWLTGFQGYDPTDESLVFLSLSARFSLNAARPHRGVETGSRTSIDQLFTTSDAIDCAVGIVSQATVGGAARLGIHHVDTSSDPRVGVHGSDMHSHDPPLDTCLPKC